MQFNDTFLKSYIIICYDLIVSEFFIDTGTILLDLYFSQVNGTTKRCRKSLNERWHGSGDKKLYQSTIAYPFQLETPVSLLSYCYYCNGHETITLRLVIIIYVLYLFTYMLFLICLIRLTIIINVLISILFFGYNCIV